MMNGGYDYVTKPFSLDVLTAKATAFFAVPIVNMSQLLLMI